MCWITVLMTRMVVRLGCLPYDHHFRVMKETTWFMYIASLPEACRNEVLYNDVYIQ